MLPKCIIIPSSHYSLLLIKFPSCLLNLLLKFLDLHLVLRKFLSLVHWLIVCLDLLNCFFRYYLFFFVKFFLQVQVLCNVFLDFAVELSLDNLGLGVVDLELSNFLLKRLNSFLELCILKGLLLKILIMRCLNLINGLLIWLNLDLHLLLLRLYLVKLLIMPLNLVFEVSYLHFQHFLLFLNELHLHYFLFSFRPSCANLVLKSHHLFIEFLFLFINYFKLLLEFIPLRFEIVDFLLVMLKVSDSSLELLAFDLKWIESTIRNLFLIRLALVNDGAHLIKSLMIFLFFSFSISICCSSELFFICYSKRLFSNSIYLALMLSWLPFLSISFWEVSD